MMKRLWLMSILLLLGVGLLMAQPPSQQMFGSPSNPWSKFWFRYGYVYEHFRTGKGVDTTAHGRDIVSLGDWSMHGADRGKFDSLFGMNASRIYIVDTTRFLGKVFMLMLGSASDSIDTLWAYRGRFREIFTGMLGSASDSIDTLWAYQIYTQKQTVKDTLKADFLFPDDSTVIRTVGGLVIKPNGILLGSEASIRIPSATCTTIVTPTKIVCGGDSIGIGKPIGGVPRAWMRWNNSPERINFSHALFTPQTVEATGAVGNGNSWLGSTNLYWYSSTFSIRCALSSGDTFALFIDSTQHIGVYNGTRVAVMRLDSASYRTGHLLCDSIYTDSILAGLTEDTIINTKFTPTTTLSLFPLSFFSAAGVQQTPVAFNSTGNGDTVRVRTPAAVTAKSLYRWRVEKY